MPPTKPETFLGPQFTWKIVFTDGGTLGRGRDEDGATRGAIVARITPRAQTSFVKRVTTPGLKTINGRRILLANSTLHITL